MVGVTSDERTTRRLPQWMLAAPRKEDRATKSINTGDRTDQSNEAVSVPEETGSKSMTVQAAKKRSRRRAAGKQEDDSDGGMREIDVNREEQARGRRKFRETFSRKRRKAESPLSEGNEKIGTPLASVDDIELTVEDLLSIAEEHIASSKNAEQRRQPLEELETKSMTMKASKNFQRDSLSDITDIALLDDASTSIHNSTGRSTREMAVVNVKTTGDPARDMLDLFLGPLLKKPVEEERRNEFVAHEFMMTQDSQKQSSSSVSIESASPVKKRGSLKDKVAMFL